MAGWGDFFGGLMDKLPIQGRTERWKNELENLQHERIEIIQGECNEKTSNRLITINKRIDYLVQLIKNKV
jgi:hypothetical protein